MLSKLAKVLAAPVIIGVLGIPVVANAATQAPASGARHVTATANTHLTNHPDSGYNGTWALDNLRRTATVTLLGTAPYNRCQGNNSSQACYQYTGTISDTGTAKALTGANSPGAQDVPIQGTPTASVKGHAGVNFYASSNAPTGALVPTAVSGPGNANQSSANWVKQFFPANTRFSSVNLALVDWTWKYVDAKHCQTWVDAYNVSQANSGDITGVSYCIPPRGGIKLSGGRSHSVSPTRQNYSWVQSGPSWDRLTIVGPGPINGHVGYVNAMHAGRITAYYTGLESGHTYVVTIQPQFYKGGPPAGKAGRVTFITV